jgi:hypothetical protein
MALKCCTLGAPKRHLSTPSARERHHDYVPEVPRTQGIASRHRSAGRCSHNPTVHGRLWWGFPSVRTGLYPNLPLLTRGSGCLEDIRPLLAAPTCGGKASDCCCNASAVCYPRLGDTARPHPCGDRPLDRLGGHWWVSVPNHHNVVGSAPAARKPPGTLTVHHGRQRYSK